MRISRIDWRKVQHLMIDAGIDSNRELARRAKLHYNTIMSEGPYRSTTLDKLADLFGCKHEDLIMYVETTGSKPTSTADAMREERMAKLLEQARKAQAEARDADK